MGVVGLCVQLLDNVCTRLDVFHREEGAGDGPATWKKVEVAMASADGGAPEGGAGYVRWLLGGEMCPSVGMSE